jgi:hypothetical protein
MQQPGVVNQGGDLLYLAGGDPAGGNAEGCRGREAVSLLPETV